MSMNYYGFTAVVSSATLLRSVAFGEFVILRFTHGLTAVVLAEEL
jgi:hypothetical protein